MNASFEAHRTESTSIKAVKAQRNSDKKQKRNAQALQISVSKRNNIKTRIENNESVGARTRDLRIKSPLLYQLSYTPMEKNSKEEKSESVGARTRDLRIKSPLLYQLSYTPNSFES